MNPIITLCIIWGSCLFVVILFIIVGFCLEAEQESAEQELQENSNPWIDKSSMKGPMEYAEPKTFDELYERVNGRKHE